MEVGKLQSAPRSLDEVGRAVFPARRSSILTVERSEIPSCEAYRDSPALQLSSSPTLQLSSSPVPPLSSSPTLQFSNSPTLQLSHSPTLHLSISPTPPLSNSPAPPLLPLPQTRFPPGPTPSCRTTRRKVGPSLWDVNPDGSESGSEAALHAISRSVLHFRLEPSTLKKDGLIQLPGRRAQAAAKPPHPFPGLLHPFPEQSILRGLFLQLGQQLPPLD